MTTESRQALEAIAGPVSRETWEAILTFLGEFRRWTARINLTAPSTLPNLFSRHVLDSAQLIPLAGDARHWLDLGSGGGFPGAIIAILLKDRDEARIDLVESNRKKAAFLASTLARVNAPAKVHAMRIEDAVALGLAPDVVTARALAPLDDLLRLAAPWLDAGARGLFHKGGDWRREIAESGRVQHYDLICHPSVIGGDGMILDVACHRGEPAEPVGFSATKTTRPASRN